MSDPAVRVEIGPARVAVLTIDQPGAKVNVLTAALWAELEAAVDGLAARTDLAGLIVASGKPGCFIAGADLNLLANATPGDPTVKAFIEQGLRVLAKLEALPYPTCAAIDGVALGGGLEVALACDYRVVGTHPKVQLGLPEGKLGLIPGWGGTQRLPRIVGWSRAVAMLVSGDAIGTNEAEFLDLVATTVGSGSLIEFACGMVRGAGPAAWRKERATKQQPAAFNPDQPGPEPESAAAREAVRVVRAGAKLPLPDAIPLETEAFLRLAGADASRAKIAAFFAARKR
ncbi:MAG TPA: enoyl-CoA hydratase-related protein [Urbifossiella sp.]|jgi:enoyl-CoA hydratase/carnithine racemase|nr:enoyl-CoA hydratase-related protein [Urbifossiella sp.]